MSVGPILKHSHPDVRSLIEQAEFFVHTLVPEKYKLWSSNIPGTLLHPVDVCLGPLGKLLVVDKGTNDESSDGSLLEVWLHYPADVHTIDNLLESPIAVAYLNEVTFVAEKGRHAITYFDQNNKVKWNILKLNKNELLRELKQRNLPIAGLKDILMKRLQKHLNQV